MSNYIVSDTDLGAIADAIRAKSGGSGQLTFPAGFVNEIENIPSGGGQTLQKLASGTYLLAEDAASAYITIPVSYSGTAVYVFCEVETAIADIAQAVSWQMALRCPTGNYTASSAINVVQSQLASNALVTSPAFSLSMLNASDIQLYRQSSAYPIKANTYKWEIWGYAS